MKRRRVRICGLAVLALGVMACAPPQAAVPPSSERARLQSLDGIYESTAPEQWYGGYGSRRFEFENGRWSLVFDFAFDPALQQRVFTFRTYGPYRVLARSTSEPRAFEAVFTEEAKFVTFYPDDAQLLTQFGMADCGLAPGVESNISASGCANWRPVSLCNEDHDLLGIDAEGLLYFGVRPQDNNMCTPERRPTQLLPPVRRRTQ